MSACLNFNERILNLALGLALFLLLVYISAEAFVPAR